MFLFRKNIILVPSDYDGVSLTKGLISLDCFNGMTKCSLRCYNLNTQKKLLLGVSIDNKLFRYDVDANKSKSFDFVIKENIKNTSDISVVVLDIGADDYNIVLWGSTQINTAWQSSLKFMLEEENILPSTNKEGGFENKPTQTECMQENHNCFDTQSHNNYNETIFNNDCVGQFQSRENDAIQKDFVNKELDENKKDETLDVQNLAYTDNKNQSGNDTEYQKHENTVDENDNEKLNSFIDSVIQMTEDDEFNSNYETSLDLFDDNDNKSINSILNVGESYELNGEQDLFNDKGVNSSSYDEKEKKYKESVFQNDMQNQLKNDSSENAGNGNDKDKKTIISFVDRLNPQIEKMFEINEPLEVLNEIFPNSKFCKVNFDDGSGYYVFGIIYDQNKPKYLCYGMPAQKGDLPPKEFSSLYQWLPIDVNSEDGDGFYMMYQDAETGKNISVEII